jgi:hypothetical protein
MATQINYLSIALTIGGHQLILETEKIPSKDEIKAVPGTIAKQLQNMMLNLSFKMEKGKVITVSVEQFFESVSEKIGDIGVKELQSFFNEVAGATKGILIDLWDLSFTTVKVLGNPTLSPPTFDQGKLGFAFKVRVRLQDQFYTNLHIPPEITNLIAINSLGLGIAFDKEFALSSKP